MRAAPRSASTAESSNGRSACATQTEPSTSPPALTAMAIRGARNSPPPRSSPIRTTSSVPYRRLNTPLSSSACRQEPGIRWPRMVSRRGSSMGWPRLENASTLLSGSSIVVAPPTVPAMALASCTRSPTARPASLDQVAALLASSAARTSVNSWPQLVVGGTVSTATPSSCATFGSSAGRSAARRNTTAAALERPARRTRWNAASDSAGTPTASSRSRASTPKAPSPSKITGPETVTSVPCGATASWSRPPPSASRRLASVTSAGPSARPVLSFGIDVTSIRGTASAARPARSWWHGPCHVPPRSCGPCVVRGRSEVAGGAMLPRPGAVPGVLVHADRPARLDQRSDRAAGVEVASARRRVRVGCLLVESRGWRRPQLAEAGDGVQQGPGCTGAGGSTRAPRWAPPRRDGRGT
jgi:hypothetical protein